MFQVMTLAFLSSALKVVPEIILGRNTFCPKVEYTRFEAKCVLRVVRVFLSLVLGMVDTFDSMQSTTKEQKEKDLGQVGQIIKN